MCLEGVVGPSFPWLKLDFDYLHSESSQEKRSLVFGDAEQPPPP